ncbi:MAG TPA: PEGA domain-containing protein, partial [Bacteroidales bacterium]|nr:PEGA domain-containing protein [Bacteroidales bacterium]
MKYKFSILAFILMLSLSSNAQNISVKSFRMLPNDMDARVNFPKTDQNGEKCTIIKVVSTEQGFVWEGDALGIVDTKFKTSEYWLYVPRGAKRLTIKHPKLGMLRNYIYPLPIKEATVYEMVLTTGKLTTIVEEYEVPTQWVVITSKPEGADVFINEQYVGVAPYQAKMEIGSYNYRIEKSMYHSEAGKFELNETSRTELKVDLKPNFGYAKINTSPEQGASVEIDGKAINIVTPFTSEKLKSGQHKLKVKKVMFKPKTLNFTISDGQTTNLNIDLEPNFAEVTIKTNPEADIYIDDTKKGYGTVTTRLNPGLHTFEAKKDKHSSDKKQQGFAAGESVNLSLHPQAKTGKADIVSTPIDANIKLDGKNYGTTPTTLKNLLIGNYTLTLEKEGFGALTKNITISENQTLTINETLPAGMPVTITSTPTGAQLIIDDKSHGATPQTVTLVFGNHNVKLVNGKKVVNEAINIA